MIKFILDKIIGSQNERELKRYEESVSIINSLESDISKLSDADLRKKTDEFKGRIQRKEKELRSELEDLEGQLSSSFCWRYLLSSTL